MSIVTRLNVTDPDFDTAFARLLVSPAEADIGLPEKVSSIVAAVAQEGDAALLRFTNEFDHRSLADAAALHLDRAAMEAAAAPSTRPSARRSRMQPTGFVTFTSVRLARVGNSRTLPARYWATHLPAGPSRRLCSGGRASYPSSVLMNAIPAKVAGVPEVVMVVPAPQDEISPAVMAAACLAGVDQVITIGGAQAIAALAHGTETVPRVDKIVGPGNRFVAEAKRQVFGRVGIDMVAGPSEILIISDGSVPPEWVTMDLFAQAEHDEYAQAVLISPDADISMLWLNALHPNFLLSRVKTLWRLPSRIGVR